MKILDINPKTIKGVPDKEVLSLHRRVHQLYTINRPRKLSNDLSNVLYRAHNYLSDEMERRKFNHTSYLDKRIKSVSEKIEKDYEMIITEKLKFIYEYDKDFFIYKTIADDHWNELIQKAKDTFRIQFDLENNDSCRQQKEIIIPQDQWKPTQCKFKCELFQAGGDWQIPIYYFRCQLIEGYAFEVGKYNDPFFIYIPGKKEGNYNLVRTKKDDGWCAPDNNEYTEGIDPEANDKDCWKSLENYLKSLVDLEIENIKIEQIQNK